MELAINLETPNAKVSGNYINVFPDGNTFFNIDALAASEGTSVESIENGDGENMVIGTDGDGVSDANERNIIGHSVYDRTVEFWGASATNVVIAGNYFGVGVDGHTLAPVSTNAAPDFMLHESQGSSRIGSNGDGVSDSLEDNLFFNIPGAKFLDVPAPQVGGNFSKVVVRGNRFSGCHFPAIPFADAAVNYIAYYSTVVADSTLAVPVLDRFTNGILSGSFAAPSLAPFSNVVIDVYLVDAPGLSSRRYWPNPITLPSAWLRSYKDNGPGDLDPAPNQFRFDLSAAGIAPGSYIAVAVTYSMDDSFNAGHAVTSPMSNPVALQPKFLFQFDPVSTQVELSWLAPADAFMAQSNETLAPQTWNEIIGSSPSYTAGRNVQSFAMDPFAPIQFYRLISQ
jgi:hypothetical protein